MKPRPAAKPNSKKGRASEREAAAAAAKPTGGDDEDTGSHPPDNKQEVLQRVSFSGLPSVSSDSEEAVAQLLNIKYETLAQIFAFYCKMSECATVKEATQLKLGTRSPQSFSQAIWRLSLAPAF